jgi:hypothetical protein
MNTETNKVQKYRGHEVEFHEEEFKVIRLNFLFKGLPLVINSRINLYESLRSSLVSLNPDVIYINSLQIGNLKTITDFSKKYNKPVFAELNTTLDNTAKSVFSRIVIHKLYYRLILKNNIHSISKVYFASDAAHEFATRIYKLKLPKRILPLGVDEDRILLSLHRYSSQYKQNKDVYRIITGGKIDNNKKIIELINALSKIKGFEFELHVFGSVIDSIRKRFIQYINNFDFVVYHGWLDNDNIYRLFASADCIIFPGSHSVLWEVAVSTGIPTLLKFWDGRDYLYNLKNVSVISGQLINNSESLELYRSVRNFLIQLEIYKTRQTQSQIYNMERLSYRTLVNEILNDYNKVL